MTTENRTLVYGRTTAKDRGIVITRGLKPGERVVTSGPDRLRDGAPVKVAA